MDGRRLDNLARSLATATSRRDFVRGLLASALVAVAGRGRQALADQAPCQSEGRCSGNCAAYHTTDGGCACMVLTTAMTCERDTCTASSDCGNDFACLASSCNDGLGRCWEYCPGPSDAQPASCADGQMLCTGKCVDLTSDTFNCGSCGAGCTGEPPPGQSSIGACVNGVCQIVCLQGYANCNDRCVDLTSDANNCGDCGTACNGGACSNGTCTSAATGGTEAQPGAAGANVVRIISWNCGSMPDLGIEPPANAPFFAAHPVAGCASAEGAQFTVTTDAGKPVGTCTTSAGYCTVDAGGATGTLTVVETTAPAGYAPQTAQQNIPVSQLAALPVVVINLPAAASSATAQPTSAPAQGKLPTTGQLAYAIKQGGHWDIYLHDFAAGKDAQLTNLPNSDQWAPAWSFDGKRLAYLSDQADGTNQVWVMDADGRNQRHVTRYTSGGSIKAVAWDPGNKSIDVTIADGQGTHLLTGSVADGKLITFLPTPSGYASLGRNEWLAYVTTSGGHDAIAITNPDVQVERTITAAGDTAMPNLNGAGTKAAYSVGPSGSRRLFVTPLPQGDPQQITTPPGDASNPVWAGDDEHVACVIASGGQEAIYVVPLDGSAPVPVATPAHDLVWYLAWRP